MARCDSYYFGNCTWGCCEAAPWIPEGLGNAKDWAANAAARGLQVTGVPTVGSIVVYGGGPGYSPYGHCGQVLQVVSAERFLVHEMNYAGFDQWDDRWSNRYDVLGFILPPGAQPGGGAGAIQGSFAGADDAAVAWAELADFFNRDWQRFNNRAWAVAASAGHLQ
jgi:CHAP domain